MAEEHNERVQSIIDAIKGKEMNNFLLVVCSVCQKLKWEGNWVSIPGSVLKNERISHSFCEGCAKKYRKKK